MTKQVLGRGFDSLIPTNFALNDVASPGEHIRNVSLDKIVANPDQPRKDFDESSLKELSESIKVHGVIQPIVVTPFNDKYRIVAGERRYRAAKIAGLATIPAIIRNHEELEELEVSLVENVQRVDLSPLEQAVSIVKLHNQFSMSFRDIANKLGKAETTISNIVRLLQLPKNAVEALRKNNITEGHARAILALKTDEKLQDELLNKIITQKLTVREAEAFVHSSKGIQASKKQNSKSNSKYVVSLISKLGDSLKNNVTIKEKSDTKGILEIRYSSKDELERYLKQLDS